MEDSPLFKKEKIMWKRILALSLALCMAALLAACQTPTETPDGGLNDPSAGGLEDPTPTTVESGTIGESALTWELTNDGTLYIKGTGEMGDFDVSGSTTAGLPWHDYIANASGITIKKLIVENGVTSLAEGAFQGCINLESAEIAASVTRIPYQCFSRCVMLRTVRAKGVTVVDDFAFQYDARLATVTLSASLEAVWDGAFFEIATQSGSFAVRLAGTAEEWSAAQDKMNESDEDDFEIFEEGNQTFIEALENVTFVGK